MLAAIAVIWFLLFVPAWTKRSEAKDQQVRESREVRDRLARSVTSGVALKASRAARTKNISLVLLILSVAVGVVALIQAAPVVSIACAPIALISLALNRVAAKNLRELVLEGARVRNRVATGLLGTPAKPAVMIEDSDENTFVPADVPSQVYGRTGIIEEVVVAEVVDMPKREELSSEKLDEILRRRRAN